MPLRTNRGEEAEITAPQVARLVEAVVTRQVPGGGGEIIGAETPARIFSITYNQSRHGLNCRDLSVGHVNRTQRALCQLVVVRDQDTGRSMIVDGLQ